MFVFSHEDEFPTFLFEDSVNMFLVSFKEILRWTLVILCGQPPSLQIDFVVKCILATKEKTDWPSIVDWPGIVVA